MCGIAGFVSLSGIDRGEALLAQMTTAIAHRGPDAYGFFIEPPVYLGHRRLSIIDVASGKQPMANEDGHLQIIYNGEIFNHADIRPKLENAGHHYQTRCDTETIIHAYEQFGPACVEQFRGMFAFAIWDRRARKLFCARDRLGIKPFYYYWDGTSFVFGSEIKALLEHPAVPTRFDEAALSEYLAFGYLSSERTMFAGVRKLMPGHTLVLETEAEPKLTIQQYWDALVPKTFENRTETDWIAECRTRLEETVQMRLMSDVPLGMFLSGGVDSSLIAALMKRMVTGPVQTFAVGYKESAYSELGFARQVSSAIGTNHHEVVIGMDDFLNALPKLIWHEDEPIAWPSSVALFFVAQLAARHVKVVLTGEGSDELFGGYARYRSYELNSRFAGPYSALPGFLRQGVRSFLRNSSFLSASARRKLEHTVLGRTGNIESLYLDNFYCAFSQAELQKVSPGHESRNAYDSFLSYWSRTEGAPLLSRMLYTDQKTYLVELLMKQDQMSMACSIESRVPLLDHKLVEFAAGVPPNMKLRGGTSKYILKKAAEDLLPHDIIYRKKMGFPTPLRDWLMDPRSQPIYDALRCRDGIVANFIDPHALEALIERQQTGTEDATDRLWRLLNLHVWADVYLNGKRDQVWDGLIPQTLVSAAI